MVSRRPACMRRLLLDISLLQPHRACLRRQAHCMAGKTDYCASQFASAMPAHSHFAHILTLCFSRKEHGRVVIVRAAVFSLLISDCCAGARIQENPGANSRVFGGQAVVPAEVLLGKTMAPHEFLVSPLPGSSRICQGLCPQCLPILILRCLMLILQKRPPPEQGGTCMPSQRSPQL